MFASAGRKRASSRMRCVSSIQVENVVYDPSVAGQQQRVAADREPGEPAEQEGAGCVDRERPEGVFATPPRADRRVEDEAGHCPGAAKQRDRDPHLNGHAITRTRRTRVVPVQTAR